MFFLLSLLTTVFADLTFKVGPQPLEKFRMIERHYFKDQLIKSFDFDFGFCIPGSTNNWQASYGVPGLTADICTFILTSVEFNVYQFTLARSKSQNLGIFELLKSAQVHAHSHLYETSHE